MNNKKVLISIFAASLFLGVASIGMALFLRRPEKSTVPTKEQAAETTTAPADNCCLTFTATEKPIPLACDSVNPKVVSLRPGQSSVLKASASGGKSPYKYTWTGSGGKLSSGDSDSATFTVPAEVVANTTYTIAVSVKDADGKTAESENCKAEVNVTVSPVSLSCTSLSASLTNGLIPLKVEFAATSESTHQITFYEFDFGDGNTEQTTKSSTSHTYNKKGLFTAKVRMRDSEGAWTADNWGDVLSVCTVAITTSETTLIAPTTTAPQGGTETAPQASSAPVVFDTGSGSITLFIFLLGFGLIAFGGYLYLVDRGWLDFEKKING